LVLRRIAGRVFAVEPKLERIVSAVGLSAAYMLDADKSQLTRRKNGKESVNAELTRRISDFEIIIDSALQVMNPEDVGPWLASHEPLLGTAFR